MLKTHEAARYLSLSSRTLERLRVSGFGPKYLKIGRCVRYPVANLDEWVASRIVSSTSAVRQ